jgi:hypothetical protein
MDSAQELALQGIETQINVKKTKGQAKRTVRAELIRAKAEAHDTSALKSFHPGLCNHVQDTSTELLSNPKLGLVSVMIAFSPGSQRPHIRMMMRKMLSAFWHQAESTPCVAMHLLMPPCG